MKELSAELSSPSDAISGRKSTIFSNKLNTCLWHPDHAVRDEDLTTVWLWILVVVSHIQLDC